MQISCSIHENGTLQLNRVTEALFEADSFLEEKLLGRLVVVLSKGGVVSIKIDGEEVTFEATIAKAEDQ